MAVEQGGNRLTWGVSRVSAVLVSTKSKLDTTIGDELASSVTPTRTPGGAGGGTLEGGSGRKAFVCGVSGRREERCPEALASSSGSSTMITILQVVLSY